MNFHQNQLFDYSNLKTIILIFNVNYSFLFSEGIMYAYYYVSQEIRLGFNEAEL